MKSSDDKAETHEGDVRTSDMTQWKSEVSIFLSEARREIRRIRESLAAEPRLQEPGLSQSRDAVIGSGRGDEIPPSPAPQSSLQSGDTNSLENLRQRLTEQLDRCSATVVRERTDNLVGKEDR